MEALSPNAEQEREQMLRKVFSNVSHDLKTPLACIIGSLETAEHLQDKLSTENRGILLQMALVEARKLDTMISNIVNAVKIT